MKIEISERLATLIGEDGSELAMTLQHDEGGRYRWYASGEDTEVSGRTRREAITNAASAWPASLGWDWTWDDEERIEQIMQEIASA